MPIEIIDVAAQIEPLEQNVRDLDDAIEKTRAQLAAWIERRSRLLEIIAMAREGRFEDAAAQLERIEE